MINDALDFGFATQDGTAFSGYKINFGVNFEVNHDRRFNPTDVKIEVIDCIKDFFAIDKMQFGQAINLNELKYQILGKTGVIGVQKLEIKQEMPDRNRYFRSIGANGIEISPGEAGYGFVYNFTNALQNDIIRPSATPSVFELRNPNNDIYGRVL
jgi:hypothetical protein